MPDDYKEVTRATYDVVADSYAKRDKGSVDESDDVHAALNEFASLLQPNARVLDTGCAAGRDSYFLDRFGFRVTGIDFSPEMVERAKRTVPGATFKVMDFEELPFTNEFDAVWANASLHHIPKRNLPVVLAAINRALKPGGYFFIKVKHGAADSIRENEKFGGKIKRYFAFYQNDELHRLLEEAGFSILSIKNTTQDEWVEATAEKPA
ncbi:MAG: methyltransferase domain-containing protein [bacterium]|nr:methyltransferase domain-containing protein [bacterium]MDZ4247952.1 methyltransferase domain-containing protein [Patescibacteria group bacterium]